VCFPKNVENKHASQHEETRIDNLWGGRRINSRTVSGLSQYMQNLSVYNLVFSVLTAQCRKLGKKGTTTPFKLKPIIFFCDFRKNKVFPIAFAKTFLWLSSYSTPSLIRKISWQKIEGTACIGTVSK